MKLSGETTGWTELLARMREKMGASMYVAEAGVGSAAPVRQPRGRKVKPVRQRSVGENMMILNAQAKAGRDPFALTPAEIEAGQAAWLAGVSALLSGDPSGMDVAGNKVASGIKTAAVRHIDDGTGMADISPRWEAIKKNMYGAGLPALVASGQLRAAIIARFSKVKK